MNLEQLVCLTNEMVATIEELDGYLFLDRFNEGPARLREKVLTHATTEEAQSWLNIVLIDQSLSQIVGDDWSLDDPAVKQILSSIEKAWGYQIEARFPQVKFFISRIFDPEYGDVGLKLTNVSNAET
ncbi:hypothetical protein C8J98_101385 [Luteibacter sp. OK325]|uniref:hypothetical protein n=1 Tax=Luteibacter sp. OK325 TaxID=2135670 RepID=UPI000D3CEAC5|nr:hypothetical protein [Luteibacter sp. OK325]PTR35122.1 hypothetical protein C8J98_101385 [Luteibacter sp. OK325]